jgi:hypothetical protein
MNAAGHSFIELLVATVILTITLTAIIAGFMSAREGIVASWDRSTEHRAAVYMMEKLKAQPYERLLNWYEQFASGGAAVGLVPADPDIGLNIDDRYKNYLIQFDLLTYQAYSPRNVLQIIVRARSDPTKPWLEKATLLGREGPFYE